MKRNLILVTSVALVILMTASVLAVNWPWSVTGKATDDNENSWGGPVYKLCEKKTGFCTPSQTITVEDKKYDVTVNYPQTKVRGVHLIC